MSDGLSYETVQEPVVPEQNRLFVIIAIGLVGLLVLGLLGIGGYVVFARSKRAAALQPPSQMAFVAAVTPTVMATNTPAPTVMPVVKPTNTPVVLAPTAGIPLVRGVINLTPTAPVVIKSTVVAAPAQPAVVIEGGQAAPAGQAQQETTPQTGFGMGALGLGAGLAGLAFVARRLRLA